MRTVLLIAFHFPPLTGSSGVQRTLRFAQYLPEAGWRPVVVTATPNAYEQTDARTLDQVPAGCEVIRVPALDAARHLAIAGRYPRCLEMPDRWASWSWAGRWLAAGAARRFGAQAVWSTYPIATAHLIGAAVAKRTGLPWVADFRDPMAQEGYPADPARRQGYRAIEREAAEHAARMVFVTPGAMRMYRERFAGLPAHRFALIENGFDESAFAAAVADTPSRPRGQPLVLLHSGIVYPAERDPTNLVRAIAKLDREGRIRRGDLILRFRAPVHAQLILDLANALGVADYFEVLPPVPYLEALAEMSASDALLAMQAANCNAQIPAKVYEYLRAGRPILGLADPEGDTGRLLSDLGCPHVAALESEAEVTACLADFLRALRAGAATVVPRREAERFSRRALTGRLAQLLDDVCRQPPRS